MKTKLLLLSVLFLFVCAGVFAEDGAAENPRPKNTITVDAGLTAVTLLASGIMNFTSDYPALIIGTAAQYERQLARDWTLAGRLGYNGMFFFADNSRVMSLSTEAHFRYYPEGGIFFLDGMLGYANFSIQLDEWIAPMSYYFTLGGRLGWRIDFGAPGGLVMEPSFGYYGAIGETNMNFNTDSEWFDATLDALYNYIIKGFFVGGPRFSLGLGYRF